VEAAKCGLTIIQVKVPFHSTSHSPLTLTLTLIPPLYTAQTGGPSSIRPRQGGSAPLPGTAAQEYEPLVIPGVSAALAGPTLGGIPVTQRGVAESFVVCTGIGRGGKAVELPGYVRGRTVLASLPKGRGRSEGLGVY
jgi:hypothetical protein